LFLSKHLFSRKNKQLDPTQHKRSLFKLLTNAEHLKGILSTMERAHCSIDALYEGIDFDYYLTRQRFEGACSKIYEKVLEFIDELLDRNSFNVNNIDKVCFIK
jgi:molecular chaperone DnaK (HSP70)